MIKVWLLLVSTVGAFPQLPLTVDNISSETECRRLGEVLAGEAKRANASNRYFVHCVEVEKTFTSSP